jgi:hypothetical protein
VAFSWYVYGGLIRIGYLVLWDFQESFVVGNQNRKCSKGSIINDGNLIKVLPEQEVDIGNVCTSEPLVVAQDFLEHTELVGHFLEHLGSGALEVLFIVNPLNDNFSEF